MPKIIPIQIYVVFEGEEPKHAFRRIEKAKRWIQLIRISKPHDSMNRYTWREVTLL